MNKVVLVRNNRQELLAKLCIDLAYNQNDVIFPEPVIKQQIV